MKDPDKVLEIIDKTAMGSFGKITDMNDLPTEKILIKYVRETETEREREREREIIQT